MSGDDTWADAPIAERAPVGARETADANRRWWDAEAEDYLAEHGAFPVSYTHLRAHET